MVFYSCARLQSIARHPLLHGLLPPPVDRLLPGADATVVHRHRPSAWVISMASRMQFRPLDFDAPDRSRASDPPPRRRALAHTRSDSACGRTPRGRAHPARTSRPSRHLCHRCGSPAAAADRPRAPLGQARVTRRPRTAPVPAQPSRARARARDGQCERQQLDPRSGCRRRAEKGDRRGPARGLRPDENGLGTVGRPVVALPVLAGGFVLARGLVGEAQRRSLSLRLRRATAPSAAAGRPGAVNRQSRFVTSQPLASTNSNNRSNRIWSRWARRDRQTLRREVPWRRRAYAGREDRNSRSGMRPPRSPTPRSAPRIASATTIATVGLAAVASWAGALRSRALRRTPWRRRCAARTSPP